MIERVRPHQAIPIDEALSHKQLLNPALGDVDTWATWLVALRAAYGLPLNEQQQQVFASISGNRKPPTSRVRELWAIVGRRGGKSRMAAAIACHSALLQQHKLAPGEVGYVLCLSQTKDQAGLVLDYARSFIEHSPVLHQEIEAVTSNEIRLRGNLVIAVHPASFRSVRGRTLICCIMDETSFWRDESSALPDTEAFRAVVPSLVTTNGLLIGISTPYQKRGLLFQKFKDHFAQDDDDVLVLKGGSRIFNPTLNEAAINKALQDDPEAAQAEWDAEFRNDLSAFFSEADVDRAIDVDRPSELPPRSNLTYFGFVDASGGRHDAYAIGIAHKEGERIVINVVRGAPPADPQAVTALYADLLRAYHLNAVTGDNFAAEWVVSAFAAVKIKYTRCEWPKSKLYLEAQPTFTRGLVSLPDLKQLRRELLLLERRTHVGGKDSVDHGRGGSDDLANVVAGCIHLAQKPKQGIRMGVVAGYGGCSGRITWDEDPNERCRVRWVKIPEELAPASRGKV